MRADDCGSLWAFSWTAHHPSNSTHPQFHMKLTFKVHYCHHHQEGAFTNHYTMANY